MAGLFRRIWHYYRQVAAVRGLLQWLGWWKYAIALGTVAISIITTIYLRMIDSWSPGVSVLFFVALACLLLLVATFAVVLIKILKDKKPDITNSRSAMVDIDEINFGYLPDSPLKHGWAVAYRDNAVTARFARTTKYPGGLCVEVHGRYAFEHEIQPVTANATRLLFSAKFSVDTVFYTEVYMVMPRGDTRARTGWLAHVVGQTNPTRVDDTEWIVPVFGDNLGDGWMCFDLDLKNEVLRTFGRDGWTLANVLRVRLRGSLSISPIRFYF